MARRPRIDWAGWHHVVNRGVNRDTIYRDQKDRDRFLTILSKACADYKVVVHDYGLMENHYHLLVETARDNLSLFMRQINANYAIYFNKRHQRTGHLWQGRYRSWYVVDSAHLDLLFRYIEHTPIKTGLAKNVGAYPYTLLGAWLQSDRRILACARHSKLLTDYAHNNMQETLERALSQEELMRLHEEQKRKTVIRDHSIQYDKSKSLDEHFQQCATRKLRNRAIMEALNDGYRQAEIARYLGLSAAAIAKVKAKMQHEQLTS